MRITVRVESAAVLADLRAASRDVKTEVRKGMADVVRTVGVPEVKRQAPHKSGRLAGTAKGGALARGAYIEVKTPYAGLINYGGTRRDVIRPRSARAIRTPSGPRASVRGARTYRGQHFMEKAAAVIAPRAKPLMQQAAIRPFARRLG